MPQNDTVPEPRHLQTHRSGASRKLLSRKAGDRVMGAQSEALEDVFPVAGLIADDEPTMATGVADGDGLADTTGDPAHNAASTAESTSPPQGTAEPLQAPANVPTWSEDDERVFAAMAVRRKASGFQRRGKKVGGQLLRAGSIAPNGGTVVATIVALVASRGTVMRADLIEAMAATEFGNAKARPRENSWRQGYVAGCVRDGFLEVVAEQDAVETSPAVTL